MAVGGNLVLELAARLHEISGVFAICPPYSLEDFSTLFMPTMDVWNRILVRIKKDTLEERFIDLPVDPLSMSYPRNPIFGIYEVGRLLEDLRPKLNKITSPALIIQSSNNPVVNQKGSRLLFDRIGSQDKYYHVLKNNRHIIINGKEAGKVYQSVDNFIRNLI
jgi:carboxylesterase